jgi:hypothetical protein
MRFYVWHARVNKFLNLKVKKTKQTFLDTTPHASRLLITPLDPLGISRGGQYGNGKRLLSTVAKSFAHLYL